MLSFLPELPRTAISFIVVLGVLVFVHEFGHYFAARWCGIKIEAFSIGFGRAIASWTDKTGTVWKLAWLPLGGYVKMHGQEQPENVTKEVMDKWIPGQTFHEKTVAQRAFVVAAGPIANFLLAIFLFTAMFSVTGKPVAMPEIGEVTADSAASRAGLLKGDTIVTIGDTPITRFEQIQAIVSSHPGQPLTIHIRRDGADQTIEATPSAQTSVGGRQTGILGVRGGKTMFLPISPLEAIPAGIAQTWDITVQTLDGVWGMVTAHRGTDDLGGPLRIAQLSGQVATLGLTSLISFIAVLSVNLGLINLFPIPVLDGGHLVFFLAEAIRGKPLPTRTLEYGFRAGFALLFALFVFTTWNDLSHFGIFRWVAGLVG